MKRRYPVIAIDGPAGSGKTIIGSQLADILGFIFFDTGVLYRAITLLAIEKDIDVNEEIDVANLSKGVKLNVVKPTLDDGRKYTVFADGRDVTWDIFSAVVDANVSKVAANPLVRSALLDIQKEIAANGNIVMVGRDVGTIIVPDAEVKIFLYASPETRAKRRVAQLEERGLKVSYDEILANVKSRDLIDSGREIAPLKQAEDAFFVDSSDMSIDEEIEFLLKLIGSKINTENIRR